MTKRRVAICLSGGLRCYRQTAPSLFRNLIDRNPDCAFDLFIYTSDTVENGAFRCTGEDQVRDRLKALYGPFVKYRDKPLDVDDVRRVYGPWLRVMHVESPEAFGYYQILSMYWKVRQCDRLRRIYGREQGLDYDLVIRLRSDSILCTPWDLGPSFDRPGVMFQSWLLVPPRFDAFEAFERLVRHPGARLGEVIASFDMGGKFSDVLFWSEPKTMEAVDRVFQLFLDVANKLQQEKGWPALKPFSQPQPMFTGFPISFDGLTQIALLAAGCRPVLARHFLTFLVMHLVLQKEQNEGTVWHGDVPEPYRTGLIRAFLKDTAFDLPYPVENARRSG